MQLANWLLSYMLDEVRKASNPKHGPNTAPLTELYGFVNP